MLFWHLVENCIFVWAHWNRLSTTIPMCTQKSAVVQINFIVRKNVDSVCFYASATEYSQCGIVGPLVRNLLLGFYDKAMFILASSAIETS